ncbi:MAG: SBBP repeat-containing protein, partial [Nitrospirae bacterium]|nr:SBBP repeat-containing protein [Nitrospirota bacterium]
KYEQGASISVDSSGNAYVIGSTGSRDFPITSGAFQTTISSNNAFITKFQLLPTLSVTKTGNGTITSSPSGISCGSTCSMTYASGTQVTLTATADYGFTFSSWTGCDTTNGAACSVAMPADKPVTATFSKINFLPLTVTKSGAGSGTITADSGTITWSGNTGTAYYEENTQVILTANADSNSKLSSWSGCDSTSGTTCTVAMSSAKSVTATFSVLRDFTLTVTKSGAGSGTVSSTVGTISWSGNTGTASYKEDTSFYLTATANSGYTSSFSGCYSPIGTMCYVVMSSDIYVTVTFSSHYDAASAGIDFIYSTVGKSFGAKKGGILTYQTQYGTYYVQEYESGALIYAWYDGYIYAYDLTNYIPTGVIWSTTLSESHTAGAKIAESYNQYASYFGTRSGEIIKGTDTGGTYFIQWFTNGRAIIAWTDGYIYYYTGTSWVSSGISWR